ncbi:11137_t:CDS:2 [Paraglomus occultum]|uniref:11137_t:CDS:1 n=1 Tax=Paraglomus occultum TaxID=144539 RepID=A0A9N9B2Q4_9GLOM|nr:11137_t:CDS:2 [Paraglomus occultum]
MKYLLSVAVLALSAIVGSLAAPPPPPLDCSVVTPVKNDVWVMGKPQTVTWSCKTAGPLENQSNQLLMHIELGTGTADTFVYTDTLDAAAKLREVKFTFILLTKYTPGDYILRLRSKKKGDVDPVTAEEANKFKWSYSPSFKIVSAGGAPNPGQVTTGGNNTTTNNTSSSTGGGSTGGSSTGGSSTGGGSSANNSTKGPTGSDKNTAGIVNVNFGVFFTTIMAAFVAAAFF